MKIECPCGSELVLPSGPVYADIILVGEFPGFLEIRTGQPWVGKAGNVLRSELEKIGIDFYDCRSANLWLHQKSKKCDPEWHKKQLEKELLGRKAALFMGSDVSKTLYGIEISRTNGLVVNAPGYGLEVAVLSFNPAMALQDNGVLGEIRLAMENFRREYDKHK